MNNKNKIFCSKHSNKHAKKHCNQCNLDLCNECALDQHIDHYKSLEKIENSIKNKYLIYKEIINQEIKNILNNTIDDITLKVFNEIQEKAVQYFNEYKKSDDNQPKSINIQKTNINGEKDKEKEKKTDNESKSKLKEEKSNNNIKNKEITSPIEEQQPSKKKEIESKKTDIQNNNKIESQKNNE